VKRVGRDLKAYLLFGCRLISIFKADQDVGVRHAAFLVFDRVSVTAHLNFLLDSFEQLTYRSEHLLREEEILEFLELRHKHRNGYVTNVSPRSALRQVLLKLFVKKRLRRTSISLHERFPVKVRNMSGFPNTFIIATVSSYFFL